VGGNLFYVDLARGAAGSEVVFIPDIVVENAAETTTYTFFRSVGPITRISARSGNAAADTIDISVWYSSQ